MKTKTELEGIITKWWVYNSGMAQMPEGRYFKEQIGDWQSGFKNFTKDGYQADTSFQCIRCSDIREGLSIHLKSGDNEIIGILNTKTGQWVDRSNPTDTETNIMRGASMG